MIKAEKGLFCSFVVLVFQENEAKKETLLNCDQIELIKLVVLNVEIIYKWAGKTTYFPCETTVFWR